MLVYGRALSCKRENYQLARFSASDYHLFGLMKEGLMQTLYQWQRSENGSDEVAQKNGQQNFTRLGYMLSFECGTLLLKWWLLKSRDVIYRGTASLWCTIHVPVLVIIPILKKKALLFDSPLCVYNTHTHTHTQRWKNLKCLYIQLLKPVIVRPRALGWMISYPRNWQAPSTDNSVSTLFKLWPRYALWLVLSTLHLYI